jgi:sugar lactone lactonase YvrE
MKPAPIKIRQICCAGVLLLLLSACGGGAGNAGDVPTTMGSTSTVIAGMVQTSGPAAAFPTVCAGFDVGMYSHVDEPMKLAFGRDGSLYVGRQPGVRIHRVAPGGGAVTEFGPPMVDPDAVLVDARGLISGRRNSVLVGGGGVLAAIFPDQTSRVIFNSGFADVDDMKFDHAGRLLFADDLPQLWVSTGGPPSILVRLPSRSGSIAIDDDDRIFVAGADGTIRVYNPDGSLADDSFATGLAGLDTYLAFGSGRNGFGRGLYVLSGSELLRFNSRGNARRIGSRFSVGPSSGTGFTFGPDDALYVSDYTNNRILRIARGHGRHSEACPG